tara:strand:- start:148 stop:1791 length:1644 start_codon:yes stop_codon:yes gene_type:complete
MSLFSSSVKSSIKVKSQKILPNLSLVGDEVRKHNVVYSTTPWEEERKDRNVIAVPKSILSNGMLDRENVIKALIMKHKLFKGWRFVNKKPELLYYALYLWSFRRHAHYLKGLRDKILSMEEKNSLLRLYRDTEDKDELSYRQKRLIEIAKDTRLPDMDVKLYEISLMRLIGNLYRTNDIGAFIDGYRRENIFTVYSYRANVNELVSVAVDSYIDVRLPEYVINNDKNYLTMVIRSCIQIMDTVQRYAMNTRTGHWDWDETRHTWTRKEIWDKTKVRRRINNIYNLLDNNTKNQHHIAGGLPSASYIEVPEDDVTLSLPPEIKGKLAQEIMEDAERKHKRAFEWYHGSGTHGKAKTFRFRGTRKIHKAIRELRRNNSDVGVVPRNMHRMTTDRKVFSTKRSVAGGSMLIDCSGSMGLTTHDIEQIINDLPASTIAGYVGYRCEIDGFHGDLRIIANNGRVDDDAMMELNNHGNNSIDKEALEWLAKQPEPRIWVSDQQCVGVSETTGQPTNLNRQGLDEIKRVMMLNNIIPIEDVENVKAVAKKLALK